MAISMRNVTSGRLRYRPGATSLRAASEAHDRRLSLPNCPLAKGSRIDPGEVLGPNNYVFSKFRQDDIEFRFGLQAGGNLVLLKVNKYSTLLGKPWTSGTDGTSGTWCHMQREGGLVLYDKDGYPLWSSGTFASESYLVLQTDGNAVITVPPGRVYRTKDGLMTHSTKATTIWSTNTAQPERID